MDKKKVKEQIENAIYQLDPFSMDGSNYDDLCKNATKILEDALKELSKPDWISVENDLPPYEEAVLVTSTEDTDEIYFSHRTNRKDVITDPHQFATYKEAKPITHWQRVDGLPCGSASRDE